MNLLISADELKNTYAEYARRSDSRLTIIFGAGASYGYSNQNNYPYRAPVVAQLLDEDNFIVKSVINKPQHQAIKSQRQHIEKSIKKSFSGDLEAYLSDLYSNDTDDDLFPIMLRYLEDVFTIASQNADLDNNNYQALLNRTRDLRGSRLWSLVTFNYDTLLEQSLEKLPRFVPMRIFKSEENYTNINPKVLKMHGGVNFRYLAPHEPAQRQSPSLHKVFTEMMANKKPTETYLEVQPTNSAVPALVGHRTYKNIGGRMVSNFPMMMIPIHTELRSENSFFAKQLDGVKEEISQSKLVVAIGYQFGDSTLIETLKDLDLKESILILVGSKNLTKEGAESKAFKEASKLWPAENIRIFDGIGFEEFVEALY